MKKRKFTGVLLLLLLFAGSSGCMISGSALPEEQEMDVFTLLRSDADRMDPDLVPRADLEATADAVNMLAADLYGRVGASRDNFLFSPYSIFTALTMTYAGARGATETEMENALHYPFTGERLHTAAGALDYILDGISADDDEVAVEEGDFVFTSVNSIWGQEGMAFSTPFLDIMAENYGSGLRLLDFAQEPEAGREIINDWVYENTQERIEDLFPPGTIAADTRMVLANAVYFKAAWIHQFQPELTGEYPFYLQTGEQVAVDMMNQQARFGYADGDGWQAVELPYAGYRFAMDIIIPDDFTAFEQSLTGELLDEITNGIAYREILLRMPKFTFTWERGLVDDLTALGMPTAFTPQADFTGLYSGGNLYISEVRHKAFIEVNEEGTEAAAATGVGISLTAMPTEPLPVTVDRPFIFLIRDLETGAILFLGRVLAP